MAVGELMLVARFGWCVAPEPTDGCCELVRGCKITIVQKLPPLKISTTGSGG